MAKTLAGDLRSRFKINPNTRNSGLYNRKYAKDSFEKEKEYTKKEQEKRLEKRSEAFNRWKDKDNRVTKKDLKIGAHDQIGAVSSSWLTSLGYNSASGEAVATFFETPNEFYYKMPYELFLDWLHSPSKGKWLNSHPTIMHNYKMRKGGGAKPMEVRLEWKDTSRLKERGDKDKMRQKVERLFR